MAVVQIADETTLAALAADFGLRRSPDPDFFGEWQAELPELSELDRVAIARVVRYYEALVDRGSVSENLVKMAVVSPLLDLAGFYEPEFAIEDERSVELVAQEGDRVYCGRLDILVLHQSLWLLVIESKSSSFSLQKALPQALAYLLAGESPVIFGLLTNGSEFRFLKLDRLQSCYGVSGLFSLLPPDDQLGKVVQILRRLQGAIIP
jgi:hypothetical protein